MSKALYRKYRPSSFKGIIGQQHIVQTLVNQIRTNRVCHAYLFCGSRGVGKTSLARIFARAVNCLNTNSDSLPCGSCQMCLLSQSADSSMDIIEIDAASNNGVDDARELRETVKYMPARGKYRVYIIDEVHMLSTAAFNALLKTLEEPPDHAVFILATTEAHKLPATVLSRCVRFDFALVPSNQLFKLLCGIFEAEGKAYEEDALMAIATAAEGSVRDALSIADMCINLSGDILLAKQVKELIGGDDERIEQLLVSIAHGDIRGALLTVAQIASGGASMSVCCRQLAATARDIMAIKLDDSLLDTTTSRRDRLKEIATQLSVSFLAAAVELFVGAEYNLRYALSPLLNMEAAVIRACKLYSLDINAIDERLNRLERASTSTTPQPPISQSPILQSTAAQPPAAQPPAAQSTTTSLPISQSPAQNIPSNIQATQQNIPSNIQATQQNIAQDISANIPPETSYNIPPEMAYNIPPEMAYNIPPEMAFVAPPLNANDVALPKKISENAQKIGENAQKTGENKQMSAIRLWGRLITFFRKNSTPKMFSAISSQDPQRVALKDNILTIYASKDNFLFFLDESFLQEMNKAFLSEGLGLKLAIEKDLSTVDMEKEVETMLNEFGKQKVNIIT